MDDFGNDTGAMPLDTPGDQAELLRRLQARSEAIKRDVEEIRQQVKASDAGNLHIIEQQKQLAAALQVNSEATARIEASTSDLVEFFNAMKGAFRVFDMLGRAAKPLGYIAAAITAVLGVVAAIKGLKP